MQSFDMSERVLAEPPKVGRPSQASITAKRNDLVTAHVYRRFENLYNLDVPIEVFEGLCAYLSILLQWRWKIPVIQYDAFILDYSMFKRLEREDKHTAGGLSYHHWFKTKTTHGECSMAILDQQSLNAIMSEKPYTFALAKQSVRIISCKRHRNPDIDDAREQEPGSGQNKRQRQSQGTGGVESTRSAQFQGLGEYMPERQWHSEKQLRESLGIRNKEELLAWLSQDWVVDICDVYCAAQIDNKRLEKQKHLENGSDVPPGRKRTSAKFLINSSIIALKAGDGNSRYTQGHVNVSNWTVDDFDIKFVVQLVREGKQAGRWWENWGDADTTTLCCTAYKVLCWLRYIHRLSSGSSSSNLLQRKTANHWCTLINKARAERRLMIAGSADAGIRGERI